MPGISPAQSQEEKKEKMHKDSMLVHFEFCNLFNNLTGTASNLVRLPVHVTAEHFSSVLPMFYFVHC